MSKRARKAASSGPYDAADPDTPSDDTALDLGVLRLPVPDGAQPRIADDYGAVHLQVPSGQLSLSVLTAPRSAPLWPGMAEAITSAQGNEGAVCERGEWGPEIQAGSHGELSWFIGADGPGWLLYGVASGPAERSAELVDTLRELIRGSVVRRGCEPLPPRTVLPLRPAEHAGDVEQTGPRADAEPTTSEHAQPLPVTAPWHPSYHGTPQSDTEATADGPPRALPGPARLAGSGEPRHSAPWPAWLDNPLGQDQGNVGRHADAPTHRGPEPVVSQQQPDAEDTPKPKRKMRVGLTAAAATLVLLFGAVSVLALTHGTKPYKPSPSPAALPEPEPSTALNTPQAQPPSSIPGVPARTPPAPAPANTPPGLAAGGSPGRDVTAGPGQGGLGQGGTLATGHRTAPHRSVAGTPALGQPGRTPHDAGRDWLPARSHHADQDGNNGGNHEGDSDRRPDDRGRHPDHPGHPPVQPLDLLDRLADVIGQLNGLG